MLIGCLREWMTLFLLEDVISELGSEEWDWRTIPKIAAAELPGCRADSSAIT